jgi:hypothetical protein
VIGLLQSEEVLARKELQQFVAKQLLPRTAEFERARKLPADFVSSLANAGYLGVNVESAHGGKNWSPAQIGFLAEAMGGGSASVLSLFAVHGMMCQAVQRWGNAEQKGRYLPHLAAGRTLGAFCLTEPAIGSDARNVQSSAVRREGGGFLLSGKKQWISFGLRADLFLVFAQLEGQPAAFLVEKATPGFAVEPCPELMSFRASEMATLHFDNCILPENSLLGKSGFGFSHVANGCLDYGRFIIGWGAVGMAGKSAELALDYAATREQFGKPLKDHALVQRLLTQMTTEVRAAQLLCLEASRLRAQRDPELILGTARAKYFASHAAKKVVDDAVQIFGAAGLTVANLVEQHYRDARVFQIIEGSDQMLEMLCQSRVG